MKQKYEILKDEENKRLVIREFAELDKDVMSLLCEESYSKKEIKSAMAAGQEALVAALRTKNLYPPGVYAEKIAETVVALYGPKGKASEEVFFDDLEFLRRERENAESAAAFEAEAEDIDELLDVDIEDEKFAEGEEIKKIDSSLKIEDDEFADLDDET
jgi:hypothetical protein